MKLRELLNKFTDDDFLITIDGLCDEMPFYEYEKEKQQDYWKEYQDRKVIGLAILETNGQPELCIDLDCVK